MKRVLTIGLLLGAFFSSRAQTDSQYDTLRRREVALNVAPALVLLAGGEPGYTTNFQLGFRYYSKYKLAYRATLAIFPTPYEARSSMSQFFRMSGDTVIFENYYAGGSPKGQLSIGFEKIFRIKRFQHGLGADWFVNYKTTNYGVNYVAVDTADRSRRPPVFPTPIDSLGYSVNQRATGIGAFVFYAIRYRLSDRLYFSASMGPSVNFSFGTQTRSDRRINSSTRSTYTSFDFPNMPLIADVSLCFRW